MGVSVQVAHPVLHRGIAKFRRKILGMNAYVAITSARKILHGAVYFPNARMDDAALVIWLRGELNRHDAVRSRHLQLVSRTVTAAIDGPSLTHPAIAVDKILLRTAPDPARIESYMAELLARYPEDHIMYGVCRRLYEMLGESA